MIRERDHRLADHQRALRLLWGLQTETLFAICTADPGFAKIQKANIEGQTGCPGNIIRGHFWDMLTRHTHSLLSNLKNNVECFSVWRRLFANIYLQQ